METSRCRPLFNNSTFSSAVTLKKEWSWGKKLLLLNEGTFNLSWDTAAARRQRGEGVSTLLIFISAEVLDYRGGSDAGPLAAG